MRQPRALSLAPYLQTVVWGGERLRRLYPTDLSRVGEAWLFSLIPDRYSALSDGTPLPDALARAGVGTDRTADFPLIKHIDAARDLSVQVHPDDDYAARHENARGKNEWWYITHAAPGARIALGISSAEALHVCADGGDPTPALRYLSVRAGEHYLIPAGTVHALGAGVEVLEVQQPSDVTYRLWDYRRPDADGRLRPLHLTQALAVARAYTDAEIGRLALSVDAAPTDLRGQGIAERLCATPWFCVDRLDLDGAAELGAAPFLRCLCVLDGEGKLQSDGGDLPLLPGSTAALLPGDAPFALSGRLSALLVSR